MRAALLALAVLLVALPARAGELRPFGRGSWDQILRDHHGRTLAVHFWSLTCAPCIAEMPEWARLAREGKVTVVLVATDPIEEAPRLASMLKRKGVEHLENWAFADPFAERLRFEVDRRWRGELPMTRLVQSDGRAESHVGGIAGSDLGARLAALAGGER